MSASIPVTRADLRLLHALRSLASVQEERRRAAHLVARCDELIARVEAATCKDSLAGSGGGAR